MDDTIVIRYEIDLVVTSGGALNKSQKQTQSFVVDIGKQMKMGDHLVKLLPPSQSWRRRKKRMMLANAVGKRSLMFGGGGGGGANTGNSGGSKNLTKVGVASKRKEDVDGTTEKGKMEKNSVKKENEIGARNTNTEDNNNTDNDDKNNRFGREHIDLDSEPEDDAGDEDRLALGNEGGGNGTVNNNATTTGTTMNNDTNNNNGRMQQQQQQQSQPQQLSQMDGTSFMGLDEHDLTDCCFRVEDEYFRAHKIILSARSRVFAAMLRAGWKMREGTEGVIALKDIKPRVFEIVLHFVYSDELPKYSKRAYRRFVLMKDEKKKKASERLGDSGDDVYSDVSASDLESDSEDFDDEEEEEDKDEAAYIDEDRHLRRRRGGGEAGAAMVQANSMAATKKMQGLDKGIAN